MTDERPVSYGRWEAEHQALARRVGALELVQEGRRGLEATLHEMGDRIGALEAVRSHEVASSENRRNRLWLVAMAVLTGLVLPVVVTTVITVLHIRSMS